MGVMYYLRIAGKIDDHPVLKLDYRVGGPRYTELLLVIIRHTQLQGYVLLAVYMRMQINRPFSGSKVCTCTMNYNPSLLS